MPTWTTTDLDRIGSAEELQIASRRSDGTLRPFVTIWVVRSADDLYVRTAHGVDNPWYRRALASGSGRVRAGGIERDVVFGSADPASAERIDAAYHSKYDRYGAKIVGTVTGPEAAAGTLRLMPGGA